jgi:hypothetical protein
MTYKNKILLDSLFSHFSLPPLPLVRCAARPFSSERDSQRWSTMVNDGKQWSLTVIDGH